MPQLVTVRHSVCFRVSAEDLTTRGDHAGTAADCTRRVEFVEDAIDHYKAVRIAAVARSHIAGLSRYLTLGVDACENGPSRAGEVNSCELSPAQDEPMFDVTCVEGVLMRYVEALS